MLARRSNLRLSWAVASGMTVCALAACGGAPPDGPSPTPTPTAPPASFAMNVPKGGAPAVLHKDKVVFAVKNGTLDDVRVERTDGKGLPGSPDPTGRFGTWAKTPQQWTLTGVLGPRTTYRAVVKGHNADGVEATKEFTLTTTDAPAVQVGMNPGDDQVVGVGMPVRVRFSKPVPDRKAAQRALKITTTPAVKGSWGWLDDRTVMWRPEKFWPAGTKVNAAADIKDVHLGRGLFGGERRTVAFSIGRDLRMNISNDTKSLTVVENGKKVRSFDVSLGKPGHTTRSGTKIVYEKHSPYTMTGDGADPYTTVVRHAQRITDSGEFLHAAPWSVNSQGVRNVSHGCTNLSPSAAAWLYRTTLLGDPVITTGTSKQMKPWDGMGGLWNYTPAEWKKLSAL